jgi:hypothetical protein
VHGDSAAANWSRSKSSICRSVLVVDRHEGRRHIHLPPVEEVTRAIKGDLRVAERPRHGRGTSAEQVRSLRCTGRPQEAITKGPARRRWPMAAVPARTALVCLLGFCGHAGADVPYRADENGVPTGRAVVPEHGAAGVSAVRLPSLTRPADNGCGAVVRRSGLRVESECARRTRFGIPALWRSGK